MLANLRSCCRHDIKLPFVTTKIYKKRRAYQTQRKRFWKFPQFLDVHVLYSIQTCTQHICSDWAMLWCDLFVNDVVFIRQQMHDAIYIIYIRYFPFLWKIFDSNETFLCYAGKWYDRWTLTLRSAKRRYKKSVLFDNELRY